MSQVQHQLGWERLSDHLSPVLVKEFRQGLRSQLFLWAFLLIHLFMAIALLVNLSAGVSISARQASSVFFWLLVSVPLLLFLPLGAMGSLSLERRDGTLDLLQLAHQDAFKLVAGKWMASFGMTLLLFSAILPYLLLRYYLGSVDVISDMRDALMVLFASGLLTALAILCSSYDIHVLRQWAGFVIMGFLLLTTLASAIGGFRGFSRNSTSGEMVLISLYISIGLSYLLFLMLKWATTQVAPVAENHSFSMRRGQLLFIVVHLFLPWFTENKAILGIATFTLLVTSSAVALKALTEAAASYVGQLSPFQFNSFWGRLKLSFLCPGSHSGFLLTMLMAALMSVGLVGAVEDLRVEFLDEPLEGIFLFVSIMTTISSPFMLGSDLPFGPKSRVLKAVIAAGIFSLPYFFYAIGDQLNQAWAELFSLLSHVTPISSLFFVMHHGSGSSRVDLNFMLGFSSLLLLAYIWWSILKLGPSYAMLKHKCEVTSASDRAE